MSATTNSRTTIPETADTITCAKPSCGKVTPRTDSVYVDGLGQACRNCYPSPAWADGIDLEDLPF